jgi:hypothetical protein
MGILLRPMTELFKRHHIELSVLIDATSMNASLQDIVLLPLFYYKIKKVSILNVRGPIELTYKHFPSI